MDKPPDFYMQSLARGLSVIKAFGAGAEELTLSQVAERVGLARSAARRALLTLQSLGYVAARGRLFSLTPRILELGYAYLSSMPLWHFAEPVLRELAASLGETVSLAVLDDTEIVYVHRIAPEVVLRPGVTIGSRLPAHAVSMGRVLLGGLEPAMLDRYFERARIRAYTRHTVTDPAVLRGLIAADRARGWSLVCGEIEEQILGVSVPICRSPGTVAAALNVSSNSGRVTAAEMEERFLPAIQAARRRLEASLSVRR